MSTVNRTQSRSGERGNVLFLILIAVALFAALSYAVTQSTRSGSGDASGETNLISSAQLTQYPAGVRTAIVRMVIGGAQVDQLLFNPPSDFAAIAGSEAFGVFHPSGGGAVFTKAPQDMLAAGASGDWYFNMDNQIDNVGLTNAATNAGNDLIAYLPNVSTNVCRRINQELGIGATVDANTNGVGDVAAYLPNTPAEYMDDAYSIPATPTITIGGDFLGQPFGCYDSGGSGNLVYYHVLVER